MHPKQAPVAVLVLFAVSSFLQTSGCSQTFATGIADREASSDEVPGFSVAKGQELSTVPNTWYCVSPWSDDPTKEGQGMELFAWRLFIALNWPGTFTSPKHTWQPVATLDQLNRPGVYPRWESWDSPRGVHGKLSPLQQLVRQDPDRSGWACDDGCLKDTLVGPGFSTRQGHELVYAQNGHEVLYEIRVDASWVEAVRRRIEHREQESLLAYPVLSFTHGQCQGQGPGREGDLYHHPGTMAVKLAWRQLSDVEEASGRFLRRRARRPELCPVEFPSCEVTLGLVGFHVTQKSNHYDAWIWSTFEHVDNLSSSNGVHAPSFHDPTCNESTCCSNASQKDPASGLCRTQITRITPIAPMTQALNQKTRAWLKNQNSVLQNYELIGVQYEPFKDREPDGPKPTPKTLRNSVIETYMIGGTTPSCRSSREPCGPGPQQETPSCMGCHHTARKHDFSFIPGNYLCNCDDRRWWIGDQECHRLEVFCKSPVQDPVREEP